MSCVLFDKFKSAEGNWITKDIEINNKEEKQDQQQGEEGEEEDDEEEEEDKRFYAFAVKLLRVKKVSLSFKSFYLCQGQRPSCLYLV